MAQRRIVPDNVSTPEVITPQASPVDTYYQPAMKSVGRPAASNPMLELARALGPVHQDLQQAAQFALAGQVRTDEASVKRGMALAAQNRLEWAKFVQQFPEFQKANPWVKFGYEKYLVQNRAQAFDLHVRTAWASDPIRNNDDLSQFDNWFQEREDQFIKTLSGYDPRIIAEAIPVIKSSRSSLQNEHINYRQNQRYEGLKSQLQDNIAGLLFDNYRRQSDQTIADAINQKLADAVELSPLDREKLAVEAYIAASNRFDSTFDSLDLLKNKGLADRIMVDGKPLSRMTEFMKAAESAETSKLYQSDYRQKFEEHRYDRERKLKASFAFSDALNKLFSNPSSDITVERDTMIQAGHPELAIKLAKLQHKMMIEPQRDAAKIFENPALASQLLEDARGQKQGTVEKAADAYASKQIFKNTFLSVMSIYDHQTKQSTNNPPTYNKSISAITDRVVSALAPELKLNSTLTKYQSGAKQQFLLDLAQYEADNPNSTPTERLQWAQKHADDLIKRYQTQQERDNRRSTPPPQQKPKPSGGIPGLFQPKPRPQPKPVPVKKPQPKAQEDAPMSYDEILGVVKNPQKRKQAEAIINKLKQLDKQIQDAKKGQ